jgi:hypothetical protein
MSGSTNSAQPWDLMASLRGLWGGYQPGRNDTSLGVPNYSGFDTSSLQGPNQDGSFLSQNPMGFNGAGTTPGSNLGPGTSIGPNLGTGQLAMSGLQTLGGLWNAYQASSLANKSFNFNRDLANTNLGNQTQAYNTNLEGQSGARFAQENKTPAQALDFFNAHKLAQKTL